MAFSAQKAVRAGVDGFARRWQSVLLASLAYLVPTEIVFGILDVDRGWADSIDLLSDGAATAAITVGSALAWVAASRAYLGDSATQAISWAARRALAIVILTVVTCTAFLLGLALLVIPGLIALTRLSLAWTAYSDGASSWSEALRRSNSLVRGHTWRMFVLIVLLSVTYLVIDFIAWRAFGAVTDSDLVGFIAAAAAGSITLPLQASVLFSAYDQLRSTEERLPA